MIALVLNCMIKLVTWYLRKDIRGQGVFHPIKLLPHKQKVLDLIPRTCVRQLEILSHDRSSRKEGWRWAEGLLQLIGQLA